MIDLQVKSQTKQTLYVASEGTLPGLWLLRINIKYATRPVFGVLELVLLLLHTWWKVPVSNEQSVLRYVWGNVWAEAPEWRMLLKMKRGSSWTLALVRTTNRAPAWVYPELWENTALVRYQRHVSVLAVHISSPAPVCSAGLEQRDCVIKSSPSGICLLNV